MSVGNSNVEIEMTTPVGSSLQSQQQHLNKLHHNPILNSEFTHSYLHQQLRKSTVVSEEGKHADQEGRGSTNRVSEHDKPEEERKGCTEWYKRHGKAVRRFLIVLAYFTIGGLFYRHHEGWTVIQCITFAVTTITTLGYGNLAPDNDDARFFTTFYVIIGIGIVFTSINEFSCWLIEYCHRISLRRFESNSLVKVSFSVLIVDTY
jgi:hypothetical protein